MLRLLAAATSLPQCVSSWLAGFIRLRPLSTIPAIRLYCAT